jgi:hypothetical protein
MGTGKVAPSAGKKEHPRLAIGVGGGDSDGRELNISDLRGERIEIELMIDEIALGLLNLIAYEMMTLDNDDVIVRLISTHYLVS